jgi:hypothetical protein
MYTLVNVENASHILAKSSDLTAVLFVKLWNDYHYGVKSVVLDADGDVVNRLTLARYAYQVELSVRPNAELFAVLSSVETDFLAIA